jgi:hypothetical protein
MSQRCGFGCACALGKTATLPTLVFADPCWLQGVDIGAMITAHPALLTKPLREVKAKLEFLLRHTGMPLSEV